MTGIGQALFLIIFAVILVCTVANIDGTFSPLEIEPGVTRSLDVNCTFTHDERSEGTVLLILALSRSSPGFGGRSERLASVAAYLGHHVFHDSPENYRAEGLVNNSGLSYLNVSWVQPNETQAGNYECTATGYDVTGHIINGFYSDDVKLKVTTVEDRVVELDTRVKVLEEQLQQMSNLEKDIIELETRNKNLEERMAFLELEKASRFLEMFEEHFLTYKDRKYYISRYGFHDIDVSTAICKTYGGFLTEVDDIQEFRAVQGFLNATKRALSQTAQFDNMYIAGTDEDHQGTWVLPSTNQPLPYEEWEYSYEAYNDPHFNCLRLVSPMWLMDDFICHWDLADRFHRFLCEIPQPPYNYTLTFH